MKSIIENQQRYLSFCLRIRSVLFGVNKIVVYDSKDSDKIDFYISDLNSSNSVGENITNSPEIQEDQYTFDGKDWKKNSDEE